MKKSKRRIHYDLLNNCNISLKIRASPYIRIIGKYYEGIVLESHNLSHIVSYILRDILLKSILPLLIFELSDLFLFIIWLNCKLK